MIMDIIFWHPVRLWSHLCTAVLLCASNQTSLKEIRRYIEAVLLVELKSSSDSDQHHLVILSVY
jgi:hypothetical protein